MTLLPESANIMLNEGLKMKIFKCLIVSVISLLFILSPIYAEERTAENLITIDFKNTDIREVLRALAAQQKVNIITPEDLKGKVTIHLTKVPFEVGLSAILDAHGLRYEKEGNIYRIKPKEVKKSYTVNVSHGLLTLNAQNVDINELLREISLQSGINIVTDKSVQGKVSVYLKDVPIESGLENILKISGFEYKKVNDIWVVGARERDRIKNIKVKDGLLTLDLKNADVLKVLREISMQAGINIVADKSVTGSVSSYLENTPLETGLRALLEANGFSCEKINGIFQVSKMTGEKKLSIIAEDDLFTIDVKLAELDEVLRVLSLKSKVNIVTCGYVRGKVNAHLTKVPLEKALRLILEGTDYTFTKVDETYVIGEGLSLKPTSLTFITSQVLKIDWLCAEEVVKILPPVFPKENIRVLKDQNALVVVGTKELIEKVEQFISKIDRPAPQIMIEALIVEYTAGVSKSLGLKKATVKDGYTTINLFPGEIEPLTLTYKGVEKLTQEFLLTLEALIREGKAKIRANPRVATLNGHEASIDVVTIYRYREHRYNEATGRLEPVGVPREIEAGIKLKIKPWVTASREINVEIIPEISSKTDVVEGLPVTSERKVKTNIRVKDGETIIIGGLIQSQDQETVRRIPILSRIPILGYLFKRTEKSERQTELVIYITPRLLPTSEE